MSLNGPKWRTSFTAQPRTRERKLLLNLPRAFLRTSVEFGQLPMEQVMLLLVTALDLRDHPFRCLLGVLPKLALPDDDHADTPLPQFTMHFAIAF